jgi:DNA-binding PadR family transcriptional regulator
MMRFHSHHEHEKHFFGGPGGHKGHGGPFGGRGGFFGRFGGGMGGSGMRAAKMLASGDLQLIILALLSEKPRHGYEIIKALEEHSSGIYTPSPGMVYPALTYLEEMSYAEASAEGTKKLYTLTPTGSEYLTKNRKTADETLDQLARFGRKMARFQKQFTEDENAEEDFGAVREQSKEGFRAMKAEFRDLRDELKAAIYEKLDSSPEEKRRLLDILRRTIDEIRGK